MAAMLRERVEGFAPDDAAVAAALRRGRPEAAVAALLLEPAARTRAPTRAEPYFLLLDGIDELGGRFGRAALLQFAHDLARRFPWWLRVVVTSRRSPAVDGGAANG